MLINTIYFNGFWNEPFAENETVTENFWTNPKSSFPAQFMTKTGNFYYAESLELDAKLLRLPYKVKVSDTTNTTCNSSINCATYKRYILIFVSHMVSFVSFEF